ncbi:hypothetical protein F4821DRAFT_245869 [Hypoxylon rubiginosum]|uniref:Uncharacterized protein n=1 Tax=Hypoxylon rubiginosum TaxID=110542 RepID=A0ACC0CRF9_9PEZI|nr:hypothetical protein F4821DRAFT_245869 [Hypoxylon rubiginosum]
MSNSNSLSLSLDGSLNLDGRSRGSLLGHDAANWANFWSSCVAIWATYWSRAPIRATCWGRVPNRATYWRCDCMMAATSAAAAVVDLLKCTDRANAAVVHEVVGLSLSVPVCVSVHIFSRAVIRAVIFPHVVIVDANLGVDTNIHRKRQLLNRCQDLWWKCDLASWTSWSSWSNWNKRRRRRRRHRHCGGGRGCASSASGSARGWASGTTGTSASRTTRTTGAWGAWGAWVVVETPHKTATERGRSQWRGGLTRRIRKNACLLQVLFRILFRLRVLCRLRLYFWRRLLSRL